MRNPFVGGGVKGFWNRLWGGDEVKVKPHPQSQYKRTDYKKFYKQRKYWPWIIIIILLCVLAALMTIYHRQIINWLRPVSAKIRSLSWGWVIPILVMILISFPPLFGHEIVAILCGVVYGLWIGFGIVAAGTFLGEVATYFAFKYVLRRHAEKLERENLNYGTLARITRDGGFWIVFIVRLSVIPSHFSTAVFATCGVNFWWFLIATFVTLPKQLVVVYLGVIIENPSNGKTVSNVVLGLTFLITLFCGGYIYYKMRKLRPVLLREEHEKIGALEESERRDGSGDLEGRMPGSTAPQYAYLQGDQAVHSPLLSDDANSKKQTSSKTDYISSNAGYPAQPGRYDQHPQQVSYPDDEDYGYGRPSQRTGAYAEYEHGAAPPYKGGKNDGANELPGSVELAPVQSNPWNKQPVQARSIV